MQNFLFSIKQGIYFIIFYL